MKINAVGVASKNLKETIKFYTILGLEFPEYKEGEKHIESVNNTCAKLMFDDVNFVKEMIGKFPVPSNHSNFAIQYDTPAELNKVVKELEKQNFKIVKAPWDAFWGQRYAIVSDPDGYLVDLYSYL